MTVSDTSNFNRLGTNRIDRVRQEQYSQDKELSSEDIELELVLLQNPQRKH